MYYTEITRNRDEAFMIVYATRSDWDRAHRSAGNQSEFLQLKHITFAQEVGDQFG